MLFVTGQRIRRLLALVVLGALVRLAVRGLRGHPTRAFDRTVDRPTSTVRPGVEQRAPAESVPVAAAPDELPFAPPVVDLKAPAPTEVAAVVATPSAPDPPAPERLAPEPVESPNWSAPVDGICPAGYPIKAKLRSGIFHLPGMSAYDRTIPDRCYRDADAATADGLRAAKR